MELFANVTTTSAGNGIAALLACLAIGLAFELREIRRNPAHVSTLWVYIATLVIASIIVLVMNLRLGMYNCEPIPRATVDAVVDHLDRQPASERAK